MYVSEIYAEGIFVTFPSWLNTVKIRSKIVLFSNERHFEIWVSKQKTIAFFLSKLSKLHKKALILHVTTTFSLKQGETRTSSEPIPHPLKWYKVGSGSDTVQHPKWGKTNRFRVCADIYSYLYRSFISALNAAGSVICIVDSERSFQSFTACCKNEYL